MSDLKEITYEITKIGNATTKTEVINGYYKSGKLRWKEPYVDGKAHGISEGYYPTGELQWEIPYVNDHRHGVHKRYHKTGEVSWETPYVNGDIHGISNRYHRVGATTVRYYLYSSEVTEEEYRKHILTEELSGI